MKYSFEDLKQFNEERLKARLKTKCAVCTKVEPTLLKILTQGFSEGVTLRSMVAYLEKLGVKVSHSTMKNHFVNNRHHLK